MNYLPDSITKRILWKYINKKIKRSIHHYHVFGVINILFDEILNDLKCGKKIKVFNLGTLYMKEFSPRKYHDINDKIVKISKSYKILKFSLSPKLKNELKNHLDILSTFNGSNNE